MTDTCKACFIGYKGAGKSALIEKFVNGNFTFVSRVNTTENQIQKKFNVDGSECRVTLLDISYDSLTQPLLEKWSNGSDGFIMVYSISSLQSYKYIETCKEKVESIRKDKDIPMVLIAAQTDKEASRQVSKELGSTLASSWNCPYHEVSAKTGENIQEVFFDIVREIQKQQSIGKRIKSTTTTSSGGNSTPNKSKVIRFKPGGTMAKMLYSPSEDRKIPWERSSKSTKQWSDVESTLSYDSMKDSLLVDSLCRNQGYSIEIGRNEYIYGEDIFILDQDEDYPYFKEDLAKKEHYNFIGEFESIGPVIISLETPTSGHRSKAMVRTKFGYDRIQIPTQYNTVKDMLKYLKEVHPKLQLIDKGGYTKELKEVEDLHLNKDLIDMESKDILLSIRYKIGILYVRPGQTQENDMYSNVQMSKGFEEFLNFIGQVVDLQGFTGYNGGLDVKSNSTGTKSVYTKHRGMEIMFHVSTLLPDQPDDLQRVEKKRHLGNDMVVLIYKEGDQQFDPLIIKSQFLHVFAVIQAEDKNSYRMNIVNKPGVKPYPPFLPNPPIFEKNAEFRDFLLTKLINGQRGAFYSNEFKSKMVSTRRVKLEELVRRYISVGKSIAKISSKSSSGSKIPKSSSLDSDMSSNSSSSSTSTANDIQVDNVVHVGKKLFAVIQTEPKEFDAEEYRRLLQQIVVWSLNAEEEMFKSKEDQDKVIDQAKSVFKVGSQFTDLQENKNRGIAVDMHKYNTTISQLRDTLAAFFHLLRDLSIYGTKANNLNSGNNSTNSSTFSASNSTNTSNVINKQEAALIVKQLIDHTFVKLVNIVTSTHLDEEVFVDLLKTIGSNMRNVASVLDLKSSKRLIEITKNLMQKGLQFKQDLKPEQRDEVTNALKTLIKELKECTDVST